VRGFSTVQYSTVVEMNLKREKRGSNIYLSILNRNWYCYQYNFSKHFLENKTKTLFRWNYEHQQGITQSPHLFLRQDESRPNGSSCHLNDEFVRDGFEESGLVVLGPDDVSRSWSDGLSLKVRDGGAFLLALASGGIVTLHTVQEILTTAGMSNVFCSDADLLLFDPVPDRFGDDDAERAVCHVKHAPSATMVVFVGHTGMNGSIGLNVDDISDLVDLQQRGDRRHSILAEWASEHVTSASAVSLGIRHLSYLITN